MISALVLRFVRIMFMERNRAWLIRLDVVLYVSTIILVSLKLTGNLDWGWWMTLLPIWLGIGELVLLYLFLRFVGSPDAHYKTKGE